MITRTEKNKKIQEEIIKEESTRVFKKISKITLITLGSLLLIILYGMYIGAKVTFVHEYKITNQIIPNSFHGTKIVHISDILYNSINKSDLNKIKNQINELNPDIIFFTGNIKRKDYQLTKEDIEILSNFFKNLNAKLNKYAIIGNQDNESFNVIMENSNFKILDNKLEDLYYKDTSSIQIIGFNTNNINFDNIETNNNYKICLFHNPDLIDEIIKKIDCNLALSGDTLGGEIKIFNTPLLDNHKYNKSYSKINKLDFYISNGLGNEINVRYFNHPSINFYRLTKY